MVLAECYHPEDKCAWPSQKYLGECCEMPLRTVQWCLARLERNGFITTLQKGNQYQRTEYQLNFNVAAAHDYEPAISEPAKIAPSSEPAISHRVNPQYQASEPATPRITNLQITDSMEPTVPLLSKPEFPEWFKTLARDRRWTEEDADRYIASVEQAHPDVDLDLEAHAAYEWLQTAKGLKKKVLRGFWTNWLTPSKNGTAASGQPSSPMTHDDRHEAINVMARAAMAKQEERRAEAKLPKTNGDSLPE
jgi:hypothetical protein